MAGGSSMTMEAAAGRAEGGIGQDAIAGSITALVLLPQAVAFEDCGHMSTLERPAAVSTALQDWMRGG